MDNIPMRDYGDNNNISTKLVKILRSKIFDRDFKIKGPVTRVYYMSIRKNMLCRVLLCRLIPCCVG